METRCRRRRRGVRKWNVIASCKRGDVPWLFTTMKALIMVASYSRLAARAVKNFVEECAPTETWESLAEGVAERVAPTVRARAPGTVGAYVRYTQAVCSERAPRVRVRGSVNGGALGATQMAFGPRPQSRRNPEAMNAFDFFFVPSLPRASRFADSRFSFQSVTGLLPRLRFNPFSARAIGAARRSSCATFQRTRARSFHHGSYYFAMRGSRG